MVLTEQLLNKLESREVTEVSEEIFDYFLDVLPPESMGKAVEIPGWGLRRTSFGFAEGTDYITYFWRREGRFYCWRSNEMARGR